MKDTQIIDVKDRENMYFNIEILNSLDDILKVL